VLTKRHGISPTTVQKWRKRTTVADLSMGPRVAQTVQHDADLVFD
jgi:transposase-like protein